MILDINSAKQDKKRFKNGMRNLTDKLHGMNLCVYSHELI
jgi:hypothetical protein